jgi:hypothetical protein
MEISFCKPVKIEPINVILLGKDTVYAASRALDRGQSMYHGLFRITAT